MLLFKCSSVQVFKCSSVQVFKCSSVQVFKCSSVQVFKCGVVSCDVPTGREDEEEEKILVFSTFLFRKRGRVLSDDRFPVTLTLLGGKDEK